MKEFSLESANEKIKESYKVKILNIINEIEKNVRVLDPDEALDKELHEAHYIDSSQESKEYEPVRKDVCETFGIPVDSEHVWVHNVSKSSEPRVQRALRTFYILIDMIRKEGFYAEGRLDHHTLLRKTSELRSKKIPDLTFETVLKRIDAEPPLYLVFKGFLSTKDFREISEGSRRLLESPIYDENGQKIETAEEWFITGHNLTIPAKT